MKVICLGDFEEKLAKVVNRRVLGSGLGFLEKHLPLDTSELACKCLDNLTLLVGGFVFLLDGTIGIDTVAHLGFLFERRHGVKFAVVVDMR
jgi:hypothetical protein